MGLLSSLKADWDIRQKTAYDSELLYAYGCGMVWHGRFPKSCGVPSNHSTTKSYKSLDHVISSETYGFGDPLFSETFKPS